MTSASTSTPCSPTKPLSHLVPAHRGLVRRPTRPQGPRSAGQIPIGRTMNTGGVMMSTTTASFPTRRRGMRKRRFVSSRRYGESGRMVRTRFASSRRCGRIGPARSLGSTGRCAAAEGGGRRGGRARGAGARAAAKTNADTRPCGARSWPDVHAWVDVAAGYPPASEGGHTRKRTSGCVQCCCNKVLSKVLSCEPCLSTLTRFVNHSRFPQVTGEETGQGPAMIGAQVDPIPPAAGKVWSFFSHIATVRAR